MNQESISLNQKECQWTKARTFTEGWQVVLTAFVLCYK